VHVLVPAENIVEILTALRDEQKFELLSALTATDYWPQMTPRFHVIYQLSSLERNLTLQIRVGVNGDAPKIPTVTGVSKVANWRERELLDTSGQHVDEIRARLDEATEAYVAPARQLSASRRAAATRFAADLERLLADLAMMRTRFNVRFNTQPLTPDAWGATGIDRAEFFISPNPGEEPRPLPRIASGGELSRIMLALKTLAARSFRGHHPRGSKTLIFDEVDAGIGGQVADVVGRRLQALGRDFQVLCITHLPQIAALGTTHFRITKRIKGERTSTSVEQLSVDGREEEVARMIGGASATAAVRTSAREMLAGGVGPAAKAKGESVSPAGGESENRKRRR
jgi:DNA repair protein RecN (Recombination protein N)